jgi:hypothetical protein
VKRTAENIPAKKRKITKSSVQTTPRSVSELNNLKVSLLKEPKKLNSWQKFDQRVLDVFKPVEVKENLSP